MGFDISIIRSPKCIFWAKLATLIVLVSDEILL